MLLSWNRLKLLSKPSRANRLVREGSWIVGGQIASVSAALVLVRVLTERLEPAQYGYLALGLTVSGLINQVVMGGIVSGIGRFYPIATEHLDVARYVRGAARLLAYGTIAVILLGAIIGIGLLYLGFSSWVGLAVALLLFAVLSAYNAAMTSVQSAARQRAIAALHGALEAWLRVFFTLAIWLWVGLSSTGVVAGYILAALLVLGSQAVFFDRLLKTQTTGDQGLPENWAQAIWSYSWPFSVWGIFTWAHQSSDRWALQNFSTEQNVGMYAVLFQLGHTPIATMTGTAVALLGPILYQRASVPEDDSRNVTVHSLAWGATILGVLLTLLGFFVTFLLHDVLFTILVAEQYRGVSHFLPWVVLAGGVFGSGQMLGIKLSSELRSRAMLSVKIITAVAGVALNVGGAAVAGVSGVVFSLVVFSFLYFAWMALLALRVHRSN